MRTPKVRPWARVTVVISFPKLPVGQPCVLRYQSPLKGWCSHTVGFSHFLSARWKLNANKMFPHHLPVVFTCYSFGVLSLKPAELRDVSIRGVLGLETQKCGCLKCCGLRGRIAD